MSFIGSSCKIVLTLSLVGASLYADMEQGKEMFDEANCMECHAPSHFQTREKKVNSFKKLSGSVRACATNSGAEWFDEDADIVTEYLNEKHYHFKAPPKEEE